MSETTTRLPSYGLHWIAHPSNYYLIEDQNDLQTDYINTLKKLYLLSCVSSVHVVVRREFMKDFMRQKAQKRKKKKKKKQEECKQKYEQSIFK
jgi:hypothetical protein